MRVYTGVVLIQTFVVAEFTGKPIALLIGIAVLVAYHRVRRHSLRSSRKLGRLE